MVFSWRGPCGNSVINYINVPKDSNFEFVYIIFFLDIYLLNTTCMIFINTFYSECVNGNFLCHPREGCEPSEGQICPNNMVWIDDYHCQYTCEYFEEFGCDNYVRKQCGCEDGYVLSEDVSIMANLTLA